MNEEGKSDPLYRENREFAEGTKGEGELIHIAHQLNNALGALALHVSILQMKIQPTDEVRPVIGEVAVNLKRSRELMIQLEGLIRGEEVKRRS